MARIEQGLGFNPNIQGARRDLFAFLKTDTEAVYALANESLLPERSKTQKGSPSLRTEAGVLFRELNLAYTFTDVPNEEAVGTARRDVRQIIDRHIRRQGRLANQKQLTNEGK